jgi:hypothetical protein
MRTKWSFFIPLFARSQALLGNVVLQAGACFVDSQAELGNKPNVSDAEA